MKRIALFIAALMGLGSIAHAQKYQMDVQTNDGLITSYLVNDMQDVTYQDGKTIITFGNKTVKTYDNKEIATVSWSENKGSGGSNAGSFTLDEDHLSVVTPDYSIEFSPTAIDKEMTLTVTKSSGTPNIMLDGVQIAVAYDFSIDVSASCLGVLELLENYDTRTLTDNESVSVLVERSGTRIGICVCGKSCHISEALYAQRADSSLGAAADHNVSVVELDSLESISDGV